jgi:hypothetical protein
VTRVRESLDAAVQAVSEAAADSAQKAARAIEESLGSLNEPAPPPEDPPAPE